jgi:hypothetical protein
MASWLWSHDLSELTRACGLICVMRGTGEKHFPAFGAQNAAKVSVGKVRRFHPCPRHDGIDSTTGLSKMCGAASSVSLRGDPNGFCLRGPEQREIDPFGQDFAGELGWLVTCSDRLDNFRGQERQPQQSSDVAGADALAHALTASQI